MRPARLTAIHSDAVRIPAEFAYERSDLELALFPVGFMVDGRGEQVQADRQML